MIDASTLGIHRVPYAYLTGHIQANSEHGEYQQKVCHFLEKSESSVFVIQLVVSLTIMD